MKRWVNRPDGSNWGEFGDDDQIGRLNLITPEIRVKAAREIQSGAAFHLTLPLDWPVGAGLIDIRKSPRLFASALPDGELYNTVVSPEHIDVACDDAVVIYTQRSTQWDALCHMGALFDANGDGVAEPVYYNGYRAGMEVLGSQDGGPRAVALGVENMAVTGVQSRGVLVNFVERYGRERVEVGYNALMELMEAQNVAVEAGDMLCLYTGYADVIVDGRGVVDREIMDRTSVVLDGRDSRLLKWITESDVAALISDNMGIEGWNLTGPTPCDDEILQPLHHHCLFKLGLPLGELWYLRELAEWLSLHRRSRFFLTAPPLRLPGSVGSPVTPVATV
jgi:kynurenine formamidase